MHSVHYANRGGGIRMSLLADVILKNIADTTMTRDDIALTYALCTTSSEKPDFGKINTALQARWGLGDRKYIKQKAWQIMENEKTKIRQ